MLCMKKHQGLIIILGFVLFSSFAIGTDFKTESFGSSIDIPNIRWHSSEFGSSINVTVSTPEEDSDIRWNYSSFGTSIVVGESSNTGKVSDIRWNYSSFGTSIVVGESSNTGKVLDGYNVYPLMILVIVSLFGFLAVLFSKGGN